MLRLMQIKSTLLSLWSTDKRGIGNAERWIYSIIGKYLKWLNNLSFGVLLLRLKLYATQKEWLYFWEILSYVEKTELSNKNGGIKSIKGWYMCLTQYDKINSIKPVWGVDYGCKKNGRYHC